MVLKEIEINGFKSFANKTTIRLEHPLTAIVGPNGCGKSNILDALKWVLGEKSVRSIRGEKMEDVIFSGTDTKKALNYAEVIITLKNEGRFLPIDSDLVKIGRRLYRDGQSQYFLNDNRVSRKEIETLLLDTGLGKSAYSFMEQGRMDMILSSKPEERRYIFEEAAGISRFKAQKEEAEKNLESTQHNITRLQDILHELERELKLKQSQAEKTKKYNLLREKQKEHDLRIRYYTLKEIDEKKEHLQKKLQNKMAQIEKAKQKILLLEQQIHKIEEEQNNLRTELHQKDLGNQISRERISQEEKKIKDLENQRDSLEKQKKELVEQIKRIEKRLNDLKREYSHQNQLTLELNIRLEDAEKNLEDLKKKSQIVEKELLENTKAKEKLKQEYKNLQLALKEKREKMELVIQDLLNSLQKESLLWQEKEQQFIHKKQNLSEKLKKFIENLKREYEKHAKSPEKFYLEFPKILQNFPLSDFLADLQNLTQIPASLRHTLFEKGGIHSQKQELSQAIEDIEKKLLILENSENQIIEKMNSLEKEKEEIRINHENLMRDIQSFQVQRKGYVERERDLKVQLENEEKSYNYFIQQYQKLEKQILALVEEEKKSLAGIENLKSNISQELSRMENLEKKIYKLEEKKREIQENMKLESEKNNQLFGEINEMEVQLGTLLGSREVMLQDIYNDYNLTFLELEEKIKNAKITLQEEKNKILDLKREIEALGPINPLALEELEAIEKLYKNNQEQLKDILKAKEDILQVLGDIEKKSEKLFLESFAQIENNFRQVFRRLFNGGDARLTLLEPEKPLYSGIEIQAQPPGKRPKSLRLLSGGEKALTAIALMFAIYMVRSSPVCILDEIDAPLDDHNVGRFLKLLDDFKDKTQFILITHNKKTMAHADAIFGVTMEDPGISKILSVELKKVTTLPIEK